jgi:broad specificity phosphatase PhoE
MTKKNYDGTTIFVVRHGESESNVYAREHPDKPASHFGELGSSLTQKGREQAQKLAQLLNPVNVSAVLSSDLTRAKETAEIIAREHHLPVITNETIRERFFGAHMSAKKKREIEKALDSMTEEEKFAFKYFKNGESGRDVVKRFKRFLTSVIDQYQNKIIVVVSHGYVMRSFLIHEKYAQYDELLGGSIKNTGYFVAQTDGKTYMITEKHGITRRKGIDDEE